MLERKSPAALVGDNIRPPVEASKSILDLPPTASDLFATVLKVDIESESLSPKIPGFEILSELGRGAFGVVYRARDVKLDRLVAIKISLIDHTELREQYIKEAKNAAKLDNPRIVPVYQVGTLENGRPFVVQRLIDGCTLGRLLADCGPLSLRETCSLMIEIALAVADAHASGIVHRDLKPENILVDSTSKPWLADFGLAILEKEQREHRGERAGTPTYMSPEQLCGRADWLDGRSDIYALGIIFYEMLTGRTPFDANTFDELKEQVLHRDPKPISQRLPNFPTAIDLIFQNCCEKKVSDRYSNAYELVTDLEAVLIGLDNSNSQSVHPGKPQGFSVVRRKTMNRTNASTRKESTRATLRETISAKKLNWIVLPVAVICLTVGGAFVLPNSRATIVQWFQGEIPSPLADIPKKALVEPTPILVPNTHPDKDAVPATEPAASPEAIPDSSPARAPQPPRPFRVSRGGEGTHTSIRSALEMSADGEAITILPGTYVESLTLDRNVKLIGEGKLADISIVGDNAAAVTIRGDVAVSLANLTLEGNKSGERDFNTVDMFGGMLSLTDCNVYSRSYECIKTRPGCGLVASRCHFRSAAHPAISVTQSTRFELVGCVFQINPLSLRDKSSAGVQATQTAGIVQRCNFVGSGAAVGIHWSDSQEEVVIEDASFENCASGMIMTRCSKLRVHGSEPTRISGCKNGISLENCKAHLERLEIQSSEADKGILVVDSGEVPEDPSIQILDCRISGFKESLTVRRAHVKVVRFWSSASEEVGVKLGEFARLELSNADISQSESMGILVQDASAKLVRCVVAKNAVGAAIDGGENAFRCDDCTFEYNKAGLLICSGTANIQASEFQGNEAGLLVATREQLNEKVAESPITPIYLDIAGATIKNNKAASLQIRTTCRMRLVDCKLSEPFKVIAGLRVEQSGDTTLVWADAHRAGIEPSLTK